MEDFLRRRGDPAPSDALTINGQPGVRYNCSRQGTTLLLHLSFHLIQISARFYFR